MQHYMCKIGKMDRQIWLTASLIEEHVCFFKLGLRSYSILQISQVIQNRNKHRTF